MGLAERKQKQKIHADPRNLTWAEDTTRFGQQYLAKYGFDASSGKGLGANLDGRTSHIAVNLKLNNSGIGGTKSQEDSVAWKQQRNFENLLAKLNAGGETVDQEEHITEEKSEERKRMEQLGRARLMGFVKAKTIESTIEKDEPKQEDKKTEKTEKKRKREQDATPLIAGEAKRLEAPKHHPHRAHRAKFRASKNLASLSSAAMSEILGVSPSTSAPVSGWTTVDPTPSGSVTPQVKEEKRIIEDQLTTSTVNVADYFAQKMKARKEKLLGSNSANETPIETTVAAQEDDISTAEPVMKDLLSKEERKKRKKDKGKVKKERILTSLPTNNEPDGDVDKEDEVEQELDAPMADLEVDDQKKREKKRKERKLLVEELKDTITQALSDSDDERERKRRKKEEKKAKKRLKAQEAMDVDSK